MNRYRLTLAAIIVYSASPQSLPGPVFVAGDIRLSPHAHNAAMRGAYYATGRYELHQATMADLIRSAWGLPDNNRVVSGPAWLDDDRFDVLAKAPESTPREEAQLMLRALLQARVGLSVHEEKRPMAAYVLTVDTRTRPLLKVAGEADGRSPAGCQNQPSTTDISVSPMRFSSCSGITMKEFARLLPELAGDYFGHIPVVDLSNLGGSWDFTLRWNTRAQMQGSPSDGIPLFDAVRRQLGLQLETRDLPLPVVVVDRVNEHPSAATPEVLRSLPDAPAEFEVAVIKPSSPDAAPPGKVLPSGQIDFRGNTLKDLVRYAWDAGGIGEDNLVQGPKWMSTTKFDVMAKVTAEKSSDTPPPDDSALRVMMRNLLIAKFKMAFHYEDRPVEVYSLVASKPRLAKADPSRRTGCKFAALPSQSQSALTRTFVCQNITLARFSEKLTDIATEYMDHPVVDSTGLKGAWDFRLSFSPRRPKPLDSTQESEVASAPDGGLTLFEALNKELGLMLETRKMPMPVLVIDQLERTPEN